MTGLMRMQIAFHKNPNLPHYQHIVPQLSKRKYSSGLDASLNIKIRHWFLWVVKRLTALRFRWGHLSSLFLPAVRVLYRHSWLELWCVAFYFYLFIFFDQDDLTAFFVKISLCNLPPLPTPPPLPCTPRSLQPKNISSRQEMSESIAMETVLKSLERWPPLWLHPIRF